MNTIPEHGQPGSGSSSLPGTVPAAAKAEAEVIKKEVDPRMHSAEHLLTATLVAMVGCPRPFTTHLEKKKSKADFYFGRELTPEEVNEVEARVNDVIARDLPVWEEFLPRSQAEQRYNLARLPETAGESIRIVHMGDYDACPCSGKHVASTRAIGRFWIVSTSYEAGALRMRFKLEPAKP